MMGGNWNPSIPTDTGTFATPPRLGRKSRRHGLGTPEKGVDRYYTGTEFASEAVNFSHLLTRGHPKGRT